MSSKNIKIVVFIVAIILIIILGLIIVRTNKQENGIQSESNLNSTSNTINVQPGPAGQNCEKNADCEGLCGNDECLISSCAKSGTNMTGECICLDTCSIENF